MEACELAPNPIMSQAQSTEQESRSKPSSDKSPRLPVEVLEIIFDHVRKDQEWENAQSRPLGIFSRIMFYQPDLWRICLVSHMCRALVSKLVVKDSLGWRSLRFEHEASKKKLIEVASEPSLAGYARSLAILGNGPGIPTFLEMDHTSEHQDWWAKVLKKLWALRRIDLRLQYPDGQQGPQSQDGQFSGYWRDVLGAAPSKVTSISIFQKGHSAVLLAAQGPITSLRQRLTRLDLGIYHQDVRLWYGSSDKPHHVDLSFLSECRGLKSLKVWGLWNSGSTRRNEWLPPIIKLVAPEHSQLTNLDLQGFYAEGTDVVSMLGSCCETLTHIILRHVCLVDELAHPLSGWTAIFSMLQDVRSPRSMALGWLRYSWSLCEQLETQYCNSGSRSSWDSHGEKHIHSDSATIHNITGEEGLSTPVPDDMIELAKLVQMMHRIRSGHNSGCSTVDLVEFENGRLWPSQGFGSTYLNQDRFRPRVPVAIVTNAALLEYLLPDHKPMQIPSLLDDRKALICRIIGTVGVEPHFLFQNVFGIDGLSKQLDIIVDAVDRVAQLNQAGLRLVIRLQPQIGHLSKDVHSLRWWVDNKSGYGYSRHFLRANHGDTSL